MEKNIVIELYNILEEIGESMFLPDNDIKFYCDLNYDSLRVQLLIVNPKNNNAHNRCYIDKDNLNNSMSTEELKIFAHKLVLSSVLEVTKETK